jgi:hypothetical protein
MNYDLDVAEDEIGDRLRQEVGAIASGRTLGRSPQAGRCRDRQLTPVGAQPDVVHWGTTLRRATHATPLPIGGSQVGFGTSRPTGPET